EPARHVARRDHIALARRALVVAHEGGGEIAVERAERIVFSDRAALGRIARKQKPVFHPRTHRHAGLDPA
ncbi:hypothetical protein, partial [Sphingomonas sp.]|uniref:hypothetical protein n=1 Tax=Sphingomonas sp. TaxID=28214 RepID=UPI00257DFAAD